MSARGAMKLPRRFRFSVATVITGIGVFAGTMVYAQSDTLVAWAGAIVDKAIPIDVKPFKTTVTDHFVRSPAAGGLGLPTAGSGSKWVYDGKHRIAAWSEHGDLTGDMILTVDTPPPAGLPSRDLSKIATARGLHLGLTPAQVTALYHVSSSAVHRLSAHSSVVIVEWPGKC